MGKAGAEPRHCECHDEPMYWCKDPRYSAGGFHRCSVDQRQRSNAHYHGLTGLAYHKLLLQKRRRKALARLRERAVT